MRSSLWLFTRDDELSNGRRNFETFCDHILPHCTDRYDTIVFARRMDPSYSTVTYEQAKGAIVAKRLGRRQPFITTYEFSIFDKPLCYVATMNLTMSHFRIVLTEKGFQMLLIWIENLQCSLNFLRNEFCTNIIDVFTVVFDLATDMILLFSVQSSLHMQVYLGGLSSSRDEDRDVLCTEFAHSSNFASIGIVVASSLHLW